MGQQMSCTNTKAQTETRELDVKFIIPASKPIPTHALKPKLPKICNVDSSDEDYDSSDDEKSVSLSTLIKSLNSTKNSRIGSFTAMKSAYSNLYTFDIESRRFYYLRFLGETSKWIINDLAQAKLTKISEKSCIRSWISSATDAPLLKFNYVSISDSSILLIGGQEEDDDDSTSLTIEYNFAKNEFIGRAPLPKAIRFPNLCTAEDNVYCCSGIENTKLSTFFAVYNLTKDFWVEGPDLPLPHAFGNCIHYSGSTYSTIALNLSKITSNIAVIGGLSSVSPKIFNVSVSVYSCSEETWASYQLEDFIRKVPRFIRPQLYIKSNNKIGVLGCKDCNGVYELDLELKSLTKKGELPTEQDLFLWGSSIEVAQFDRDPVFLFRNISPQEFSEFQRLSVLKYNHKSKGWEEV